MAEINESMSRKDKYMTPNLQGNKGKIINKLNHAAYGGGNNNNNGAYYHERN